MWEGPTATVHTEDRFPPELLWYISTTLGRWGTAFCHAPFPVALYKHLYFCLTTSYLLFPSAAISSLSLSLKSTVLNVRTQAKYPTQFTSVPLRRDVTSSPQLSASVTWILAANFMISWIPNPPNLTMFPRIYYIPRLTPCQPKSTGKRFTCDTS